MHLFVTLSKEKKTYLASLIILIGFIVAVFYHFVMGFCFKLGYPYDTFLFRPDIRFSDFVQWFNFAGNNNPYLKPYIDNTYANVFPFPFFISHSINFLGLNFALFIFIFSFLSLLFYITYNNIKTGHIVSDYIKALIISCLSYPVIFSLDRSNFENYIFILIYFYVIFFSRKKYLLSAIFLSLAVALKPFPLVLIILLIAVKKYKEIIITIILSLSLTIGSLLTLSGGVVNNVQHLMNGLKAYGNDYVIGNEGLYFGNSLFGGIKIILAYLSQNSLYNFRFTINRFLGLYFWGAVITMVFISIYVIFIEKELWKRVSLLVFPMNLLPYISADYRLLYIFIPFFLFINKKEKDKYDLVYIILFSLLMIPKNYLNFSFPALYLNSEANLGIIINPMIMLFMSYLIIKNRWDEYYISLKK